MREHAPKGLQWEVGALLWRRHDCVLGVIVRAVLVGDVGVAEREEEDFDFLQRLEEQNEELEVLNIEARDLEERIAENVALLLEGE